MPRLFSLLTVVLILWSSSATAADCTSSDAPSAGQCDGSASYDICFATTGFGADITCNLAVNGQTSSASLVAVTNYGTGSRDFSFYGTDADGNSFCCAFDDAGGINEFQFITLMGSSQIDAISANNLYDPGGSYPLNLSINGLVAADLLIGSDVDLNAYIWGGPGADHLASDGQCYAYGEAGDDYISGSDSSDALYGFGAMATGADLGDDINGNGGNDYLEGDDGNDILNGDAGIDSLFGDDGLDLLCGGTGEDYLEGNNGNDDLWGGTETDEAWGGGGYNRCSAETQNSCNASIGSKPTGCN